MELQTTIHDIWKVAISASETAIGILSIFEGNEHVLIEDAIKPLRRLVQHGRTYEKMTNYQPPIAQAAKVHKPTIQIDYNQLEPGWKKIDEATIQVPIGNGKHITAISITTEDQLKAIIPEIHASPCIAVDCEFQAIKKELPVLKLVQIAVSKEKGFAIQVDVVGIEAITRHLKPVLEDDKLNQTGWAYRADAMAIESFIKNIELATVLDLQAKLKLVTGEQLSLNNAMAKFATDWEGFEAFTKIKAYRDAFQFSAEDCIWNKHPLPPKALVYSVFDVVSLVALNESTSHYPTIDEHHWPFTVTKVANPKTVEQWHRQRAIVRNAPSGNQGILTIAQTSTATEIPDLDSSCSHQAMNDLYHDNKLHIQSDLNKADQGNWREELAEKDPDYVFDNPKEEGELDDPLEIEEWGSKDNVEVAAKHCSRWDTRYSAGYGSEYDHDYDMKAYEEYGSKYDSEHRAEEDDKDLTRSEASIEYRPRSNQDVLSPRLHNQRYPDVNSNCSSPRLQTTPFDSNVPNAPHGSHLNRNIRSIIPNQSSDYVNTRPNRDRSDFRSYTDDQISEASSVPPKPEEMAGDKWSQFTTKNIESLEKATVHHDTEKKSPVSISSKSPIQNADNEQLESLEFPTEPFSGSWAEAFDDVEINQDTAE